MKKIGSSILLLLIMITLSCEVDRKENPLQNTFCNPINIEYNFWNSKQKAPLEGTVSHREAADPVIIVFKNEYYLFASHSSGYWNSTDLVNWKLITSKTHGNLNGYAPTLMVIGDTLYCSGNGNRKMYCTADPKKDEWKYVNQYPGISDPCLFADDDGKVYCYHGLTKGGSIKVVELDPKNKFNIIEGSEVVCFSADAVNHGCESPNGKTDNKMAFEGAGMVKHEGKYYLEYAVPGTSTPLYNDGCYISESATGPFSYAPNSPTSFKPAGFVYGAGHSTTFKDLKGNYWHVTTSVVSQLYRFERRLALYPVTFDNDGLMHANTYLGDYPQLYPHDRPLGETSNLVGSMLVSKGKPVSVSSTFEDYSPEGVVDENVKTWWSAKTADVGEWMMVDLEQPIEIGAIQINFAEQDIEQISIRDLAFSFSYTVECAETPQGPWELIIDKTKNPRDLPHDYVPLDDLVKTRYLKITNHGAIPAGGKFAIRAFRVFGFENNPLPQLAKELQVKRDSIDPRKAQLTWETVDDADGYIIRFGIAPDKLYNHYQIDGNETKSFEITTLNVGTKYYFTVDTYNTSGVQKSTTSIVSHL